MNWLDIVLIVFIGIAIVLGLKNGLIKAVLALVGIVVGIILAGHYYIPLSERLTFISSESAAKAVAFALIVLGVMAVAALLAALLIIGPLLFSTVRTAAQAAAAFQTPNDWVMIDPAGARTTANFINAAAGPQDLVIASPGLAWLIHAHVTDFQITLAAAGQATTHFPGDFAPDRFAYDCRTGSARYAVVDRLWRNWAAPRMPGSAALLDQVSGWPSVFSTGEFTVYANPDWTDDRGQK